MSGRPPATAGYRHEPALLEEVVDLLAVRPGHTVVDGTLGGGGHAHAILERNGPAGTLVGLDVDDEALEAAGRRLEPYGNRVHIVRSSFRRLAAVLAEIGLAAVDAVLLDLGVSSRQLDAVDRGFRFGGETADVTPLDMRMDRRQPEAAADLLARADVVELERIFREFGELPGARRLAHALVEARRERPLRTSGELLAAIERAGIGRGRRHHPATLVFQALRIAVNDELGALSEGLDAAIDALRPGGRLAVIAYHSLEDRLVKNRFRDLSRERTGPPGTPDALFGAAPRLRLVTRRPVRPSDEEIARNPRARSARLRVAERREAA